MRRKFDGVEIYHQMIQESLVSGLEPTMRELRHEALSVIDYYRSFNLGDDVDGLGTLIDSVLEFIVDQRLDIAERSTLLLVAIMDHLVELNKTDFIINIHDQIMNTLVVSITDTFHNQIMDSLCECFRVFIQTLVNMAYPASKIDSELTQCLQGISTSPVNLTEVSRKFRTSTGDKKDFADSLNDFLVSFRYASATDADLFKKDLKFETLRKELEELQASHKESQEDITEKEFLAAFKNIKL